MKIETFKKEQAKELVTLWRESKEQALGQKEKHSFDDHVNFLLNVLSKTCDIDLCMENDNILAFVAYDEEWIQQLYVSIHAQGQGLGSMLLNHVMEKRDHLKLYTFDSNHKAKRFYEKHGFIGQLGSYDNEEGLLDILYIWNK